MRHLAGRLKKHWIAGVILALFLGLGVIYSLAVPVFEASDELHHYPFVAHLARGEGLPVQRSGEERLWQQEGSQPPLYYAVMAALTAWINTDDLPAVHTLNPHARIGIPLAIENRNMVIHTEEEAFPWRGTRLAVHLVRFFSLLLAAGTIVLTYLLGLAVFPDRPIIGRGAMAVHAFIPMYIFISASVNNDNLVIFLASLTLLLLVRLIQRGATRPFLVALGFVIGLACLTKLSALGLIPLAVLGLALRHARPGQSNDARRRPLTAWLIDCALFAAPILLIAGWWYGRNWMLYGDMTGTNAMLDIAGRREALPSLPQLWSEFQGFRINFWGLFGGVNVLLQPVWAYLLLDLLTIAAGAGLIAWGWQQHRNKTPTPLRELLLLAAWILIESVLLVRWTMLTLASQGRLIFPALSAFSIFFVLGLIGWLPRRLQRWAVSIPVGFLFVLSVSAPFTAIRPTYARAPIMTKAEIPSTARPFNATYGDTARLLAFEVGQRNVRPGGTLPVTLYWEALQPTQEDLSVYVQLVTRGDQILAQTDSYPGHGTRPTSSWQTGQVIRDTYHVPVRPDATGSIAAQLQAGLYRTETLARLPATDPQGRSVNPPVLDRVKIEAPAPVLTPTHRLDANLDNSVRLVGYDLPAGPISPGADLPITLYWQVLKGLGGDYTVFIHLLNGKEAQVSSGDGPPLDNWYPTSYWAAGESLTDPHLLRIPTGTKPDVYRIAVGLYDPISGRRLPIVGSKGEIQGDRIDVAQIDVGQ